MFLLGTEKCMTLFIIRFKQNGWLYFGSLVWNKGLQKGLTQYVGKTYDEEREEREEMEILEQQLENNTLLGQALIVDQEIALLEQEENQLVADRIDADVFDMSDIPDDDNMDEYVDDSYRLEYEEE